MLHLVARVHKLLLLYISFMIWPKNVVYRVCPLTKEKSFLNLQQNFLGILIKSPSCAMTARAPALSVPPNQ
jgi:hypothetical protein